MKNYLKFAASFWIGAFLMAGSMPSARSGAKAKASSADATTGADESRVPA
jgi:hypothetical protein